VTYQVGISLGKTEGEGGPATFEGMSLDQLRYPVEFESQKEKEREKRGGTSGNLGYEKREIQNSGSRFPGGGSEKSGEPKR